MHDQYFIPNRFAGKTILITGGGSGMGEAAALRAGKEGANVVIAGRRKSQLDDVATAIRSQNGSAIAVPTDVSQPDQVERLIETTVSEFGSLDGAWNNAGIMGPFGPMHDMSAKDEDQLTSIHYRGVFHCMQQEIKTMRTLKIAGSIVNTSSWTAHGVMPGIAAYAANKAAIDGLSRTTALENGDVGITINAVAPGIIATPMAEEALGNDPQTLIPFSEHTPLRRIGTSQDVADVVLFLLSHDARFITGQSILVDGGFTLGGLRPWTLAG